MSFFQKPITGYMGFFTAGFTIAAWAPLIPFVKETLHLNATRLGFLLLFLGVGSIVSMPFAGALMVRLGPKKSIALAGLSSCFFLWALTWMPSYAWECAFLFLYGVALASLEVLMNLYGTGIEKKRQRCLLSGLHACYSIGEVLAAGVVTLAFSMQVSPFVAIGSYMLVLVVGLLWSLMYVEDISVESKKTPALQFPRGVVVGLALLCAVIFFTEGAMLDWSALYLHEESGMSMKRAGIGYTIFVFAMAIARCCGDAWTRRWGSQTIVYSGLTVMVMSLLLIVCTRQAWVMLVGLFALGLGLANVAPLLISAAAQQNTMPAIPAVTAVTAIGYIGLMLGPGFLGFIAEQYSLVYAFGAIIFCIAVTMVVTMPVRKALS